MSKKILTDFNIGTSSDLLYNAEDKKIYVKIDNDTIKRGEDGVLYIPMPPPKRIFSQSNKTSVSVGTSVKTLSWHEEIEGVRGNVEISIKLPTRHDGTDWGGLYVSAILIVNGTKYDLGNEGYGGGVMSRTSGIDEHTDNILINIGELDSDLADGITPYNLQVLLEVRSYSGTTKINASHDINKNLVSNDGEVLISAQNQNWSTIRVTEIGEVILS